MGARYLSRFTLPDQDSREAALEKAVNHRTCYNNYYPFPVFDNWDPVTLTLAPITVLYGGNGSGKTTLLNLMGEKLGLERRSVYNRSSFFRNFVDLCRWEGQGAPPGSRVLTSDDVFDDLLDLRSLNQGVDRDREALLREYKQLRGEDFQLRSLKDYEHLKQVVCAKKKTSSGSAFVRQRLGGNVRGKSNGETAFPGTLPIRSGRMPCTCWTSRRTACPPAASGSWQPFWRTLPGFSAASSSCPPIPPSCWP